MQFQVPQNITMEDRIVGPLSMIQFILLVVGGFIAFFVFTAEFLPTWIARGAGGLIALTTVVLVMGKFNDQPLYRFFRYIIAFVVTPKTRIWRKAGGEHNLIRPNAPTAKAEQRAVARRVSKEDIYRLATLVDSRGQIGTLPPVVQPEKKS